MATSKLGLNDLNFIRPELHTVKEKWLDIGMELRVSPTELRKIAETHKQDNRTCMNLMLMQWLESGDATWKILCEALKSSTVGESDLGTQLQEKHCTETGKSSQTTESQSGTNANKGTSSSTSEKSGTSSQAPDHPTAKGTSHKNKEKPSESAKEGESGISRAKKRHSTSDASGPSTAKKAKPSVKLPDSFENGDFLRTPDADRFCVKCSRVPFNPKRSVCCKRLYCESCSKKNKRCRTHKEDLHYTDDKELYSKIQKLKIKCPNRRVGCDWNGIVLNLKNHLPICATGGQAQGKGVQGTQKTQHLEKESKATSKSTESGPSVTMANQIHITVHHDGVGDKNKQKQEAMNSSTSATERQYTEAKGAAKPAGGKANECYTVTEEPVQETSTTISCLPLNVVMRPMSDYQISAGKTWFSPAFQSHQLGYKLRLAVKVKPQALPNNLELNIGIVLASGDQRDFLKFPCIGDATVQVLNPLRNKQRIDIAVGFMVSNDDEPGRFAFAPVPKEYIYKDCLFFRVVKVDLDEEYKPWLLDPDQEADDSDSINSEMDSEY